MKYAIINIYASYNNTQIVATDSTGAETITKSTGGMITKSQSKEGSPYVAMKAAEQVSDALKDKGYTNVVVRVRAPGGIKARNPGQGADAAITSFTRAGLNIMEIMNVTPVPHDSCRKSKKYRAKKR